MRERQLYKCRMKSDDPQPEVRKGVRKETSLRLENMTQAEWQAGVHNKSAKFQHSQQRPRDGMDNAVWPTEAQGGCWCGRIFHLAFSFLCFHLSKIQGRSHKQPGTPQGLFPKPEPLGSRVEFLRKVFWS